MFQAVLVREENSCPYFNTSCPAASIRKTADGCCNTCIHCTDVSGVAHNVGDTWNKDVCTQCTCTGIMYTSTLNYGV